MVKKWQEEYRNSPNASEIARALGKPDQTVRYSLLRLNEKGYVDLVRVSRRMLIVPLAYE